MRTIEELLLEHSFFRGFPPELSKVIAKCGKQIRIEKGAYLYRQGEAADTFYLLRRGQIGLEWHDRTGAILIQTEHPGDVINTGWIVPPYLCSSDARAIDVSLAVALDGKCLRDKCEADHHLGYELMKRFVPILIERLSEARFQALDVYGMDEKRWL